MFVAPSVDSLAAASILTALMRRDSIRYVLIPVYGYEELALVAHQLLRDTERLSGVVLINMGAVVDVAKFLDLNRFPECSAYVIDYHRPVHQHNIHNSRNVVVFADTAEVPEPRGIEPEPEPVTPDEAADSGGGDDDHDGNDSPLKRRRHSELAVMEEQEIDVREEAELRLAGFGDDLASGSFYGMSGAMLMYELAAQEASETAHVLWLAILGLTEHFIQHRCSTKQYVKQTQTLRQATITSPDRSLRFEQYEFQFVLHRHWTLYDSMTHSPQIATRLQIWTEAGRRRLDQLFAKMGFSLAQCRQKYSMMDSEIKDLLPEALEKYATEFDLHNLTFPSFVKTLDNKLQLSASDCVYAVQALLEAGVGRGSTTAFENETVSERARRNFWSAFDALSERVKWDLVTSGLKEAVELQQAVVREGVDMLLKRIIVRNGPFRYAVLHDSPNLDAFAHVHVLTRLALFLLDSLKRPGKPSKPLVVCALNRARNTYLVLGVTPAAPSTRAKRNDFGVSFLQAAKLTGASIMFSSFDSSVIEVLERDQTRFIELLHSGLLDE